MTRIVSTGKIAKVLQCSPRLVAKWIDDGKLKGFTLPDSKHRRVMMTDLVDFAKGKGLPEGVIDELKKI